MILKKIIRKESKFHVTQNLPRKKITFVLITCIAQTISAFKVRACVRRCILCNQHCPSAKKCRLLLFKIKMKWCVQFSFSWRVSYFHHHHHHHHEWWWMYTDRYAGELYFLNDELLELRADDGVFRIVKLCVCIFGQFTDALSASCV